MSFEIVIWYIAFAWSYHTRTANFLENWSSKYLDYHRCLDCLLNPLFGVRSKTTSKLRVTGFVRGIQRWPVSSPLKGPVTQKGFHLMTSSCSERMDWVTHKQRSHEHILLLSSAAIGQQVQLYHVISGTNCITVDTFCPVVSSPYLEHCRI